MKHDLFYICSGLLARPMVLRGYLQLAVNRQPGYRQGPRRASLFDETHELITSKKL